MTGLNEATSYRGKVAGLVGVLTFCLMTGRPAGVQATPLPPGSGLTTLAQMVPVHGEVVTSNLAFTPALPPGASVTETVFQNGNTETFFFGVKGLSSLTLTNYANYQVNAFGIPARVIGASRSAGTGDTITVELKNNATVAADFEVQVTANSFVTGDYVHSGGSNALQSFAPPQVVPEPSTLVLACLAGVPFAIGRFRRWGRKNAAQEPVTV